MKRMPAVKPRRLYDSRQRDGYLESLDDWYHNNKCAVEWFLQNAAEIRMRIYGAVNQARESKGKQ